MLTSATVCLVLLPLAVAGRAASRSWVAPAAFIPGFWLLAILGPLLLYNSVPVESSAVVVLVLAAVCAGVGALLVTKRPEPKRIMQGPSARLSRLRVVAVASFVSAAGAAALTVGAGGFALGAALSPSTYLEVANAVAVQRYGDASAVGASTSLLLAVAYVGASVCPAAAASSNGRLDSFLHYLPLVGICLYSAVSTARLPLLIGAALTATSVYGRRLADNADAVRYRSRSLLITSGSIVLLGATFAAIGAARIGRFDVTTVELLRQKLSLYAFGYLPAFSNWWGQWSGEAEMTLGYGTATVAGVELVTGQSRDATRAYDEFTTVAFAGAQTNVYTAARGLILDFGLAGSAVVLVVFGLCAAIIFNKLQAQAGVVAVVTLSFLYAALLLSVTLSLFSFTNFCLAMLISIATARWVVPRKTTSAPGPLGFSPGAVDDRTEGLGTQCALSRLPAATSLWKGQPLRRIG